MSIGSRMSFAAVLRKSRPYRGHEMLLPSSFSLSTSQRRGTQWSNFSIGSNTSVFSLPFVDFQLSDKPLAEEPSILQVRLPMKLDLLFNRRRYDRDLGAGDGAGMDLGLLQTLLDLDDLQAFQDMIPNWDKNATIGFNYLHTHIAGSGGKNLMKALLDSGADPKGSKPGQISFMRAALSRGNKATLRVLLLAGVDAIELYDEANFLEPTERLWAKEMIKLIMKELEEQQEQDAARLLEVKIPKDVYD